jgi:AraC-like DNA-binding protein
MTLVLLLNTITCVSFFLLGLIGIANPSGLNTSANRWLGLFWFSAGCMLLNPIIYQTGAGPTYTQLIAFNELTRFMIAPALYVSVQYFTSPAKQLKAGTYLHFIPFALFFIYMASAVFASWNVVIINTPSVWSEILGLLMAVIIQAQLLVYWVLAWHKLNQHQKDIRLTNSAVDRLDLKWLKLLLLGIAVMLLTWMFTTLVNVRWLPVYSAGIYLMGLMFAGYFMLAQKEVYPFEPLQLQEISLVIAQSNEKSVKPRFNEEQSKQLQLRLNNLMLTEKFFLNNELSLPDLAEELALSTHDLSYLLNEVIGISFFQYINTCRVEEAKRLMISDEYKHLNILGIAYSAGFNSKTTFNTAFKKQTGLSPSQYLQANKATNTKIVPTT